MSKELEADSGNPGVDMIFIYISIDEGHWYHDVGMNRKPWINVSYYIMMRYKKCQTNVLV